MASDFTRTLCISYNDFSLVPFALVIIIFLSTDATIGFVNTNLDISENGGQLEFEIAVLDGTLHFDVLINFATENSDALGIEHLFTIATSAFRIHFTYMQLGQTMKQPPHP